MFASLSRKETMIRAILIAVILFDALASSKTPVYAEQESGVTSNSSLKIDKQDDNPPPSFERPVPRLGDRNKLNISSTLFLDNPNSDSSRVLSAQTGQSDLQARIQARSLEAGIALDNLRKRLDSFKLAPNQTRAVPATGKDIFSSTVGSVKVFTVTTLADTDDGTCDNNCSFREAIYAANDSPGRDTITFSVGGTIQLNTALPYMLDPAGLTINDASNRITITGKESTPLESENSLMVENESETCSYYVEGPLTLSGTHIDCAVETLGPLTLTAGSFIDGAFQSHSTITIADSNLEDCLFDGLDTFTITNSSFVGGDIFARSTLAITDSEFSNGSDGYSIGTQTITNSTFSDVTFGGDGFLNVTDGDFSSGSDVYSSDGIEISGGTFSASDIFILYDSTGTVTISDSILTENSYIDSLGAVTSTNNIFLRSNIYSANTVLINTDDTLTIANSTLFGKGSTTPPFPWTPEPFTGTIPVSGDLGSITNSSIIGSYVYSDNALTINSEAALISTNSTFLGSDIDSNTNLSLYNTILSNNSNCLSPASAGSRHNLVEADGITECGLTNGANNNIVGLSAGLGALTGGIQYFELDINSPAIDAGDDSLCASAPINNTAQNGVLRPQGDHCDIGAFEAPPAPDVELISVNSPGGLDACMSTQASANAWEASPINTYMGGYEYAVQDLSIPTSAGALTFARDYASLAIANSTTLSPGWTHNHDLRLIMPEDPGGQEGMILFKAHTTNQYSFKIVDEVNGVYSAAPGLCASLVREAGTPVHYVVTNSGQKKYTFDENGVLLSYSNAEGHAWIYTYPSGKLHIGAEEGKFLEIDYDLQGRVETVSDHAGRSVSYTYNANGDLETFTDVLEQTWRYEYTDPNFAHYLTRVVAPGTVTVERTEYYPATGKAWKQYDGDGNLVVDLIYNPDGTTTVKDALGNEETHTYNSRGTLTHQTDAAGGGTEKTYLANFRPFKTVDGEGNATYLNWSASGANLTRIVDATGNLTDIAYNALNGPTNIIDPAGYETRYFYNDPNFPTLPSRIEYPLSFDNGVTWVGTDYTYYPPSSGTFAGRVMQVTDALNHKTFYEYEITTSGHREKVTVAYQTPNAQTTKYDYDDLGRLIQVIDEQDVVTHNEYDDAGQLIMTVHRAYPSDFNPNTFIQNLVIGDGIYNIVTRYRYDPRGNQIAVVDTNWVITRTYYDLASRPVGMVQNLVINGTPPASEADVTAAISMTEGDVPAFDPAHPDRNIHSTTEYDDAGNVFATTDPMGITARTFYDEANRPSLTIQNFSGTGEYNPVYPDQNVRTQYFYDANGNVIATKDTLGIYTRTYYDSLNRPKIIVQNWVGSDIYNDPAPNRALGECGNTINVCTENFYDKNGNLIAVQDPNGIYTRTYYDALNRTVAVVQNLAGKSYTDPALPDPGQGQCGTDVNICSFTYYDEAGNVMATVDPRGVVTRTYYDSANRPVTIVNNLVNWDIYLDTPPARGNGLSDENVRTDIDYDSFGRRDTITDPFERVTKYEYNQVGQLAKVTTNYVNGGDPQNEDDQRNIVTAYEYDALGRQVKTIDTMGRVSLSVYDDLGRVLSVTQNYHETYPQNHEIDGDRFNIVTTYDYDVRGNQIGTTDTANIKTRTYYDALGRPISTVRNLTGAITNPTPPERGTPPNPETNLRTDTIYLGNGSVDYVRDEMGEITDYGYDALGRLTAVLDPLLHSTSFEYDANGNRTLMIDAESVSTRYEYDGLNRLKAVVENYRPAVNPDHEINVRTEYTYDAGGNRLSILDGNNHSTFFTYTAFGQVETETDALGNDHTYEYDSMGNRRSALDANDALTSFGYDELNRLIAIDYPGADPDTSFAYDALGRRLSMTDGLGTTTWDYNNLDLPDSITDPFSTQVSYEYDEVGNRTLLSYGSQSYTYQYYTGTYQLEKVISDQVEVANYQYDASGHLKTVTRPNNVTTTYNYYDNGWLQDIFHTSGTETLASYQYQYYADGNRSQVIENVQYPGFAYGDSNPGYELASNDNFKFTSLIASDPQETSSAPSQPGQTLPDPQQADFGRLPLSFAANIGQFDKYVLFQTNSLGGSIFFTSNEVVLALVDKKDAKIKDSEEDTIFTEAEAKVVRIEYKGTDQKPVVEGLEFLPGTANFMVGSDKKTWVASAPTYNGIVYRDLYPGVDLTYEGAGNSLKSTFLIAAGADPNLIQWRYKDAGNVDLDSDGNLLVVLPSKKVDGTDTTLIEHAPVAWQELDGGRVDVPVEYALAQNGEISFVFPDGYDATLPLVIDPVLTYSTYLGDIGTDVGTAITTDASGNVYVTGYSWCGNFPTVDPITGVTGDNGEVIVSKISADGSTLLYSTCVGGTGDDFGKSIALDTQGRIVVAGVTNSTDFPIVSGIGTYGGGTCSSGAPCQDTFVLALNSDGSAIRYSTYLGGDGREEVGGVVVDGNGKIVLVGSTTSTNFPTANAFDTTFGGGTCTSSWPCYDVTVTKIDPDLSGINSILYSTYLGGVGRDKGYGVVLDSTGKVYLVGYSDSDGYPVRNALQATRKGGVDIIVSQIDPSLSGDASLLYSTYFGSTNQENGFGIARDSAGNLYLTGRVSSPRFPLRDALQYLPHSSGTCSGTSCYEAFVTKIDISTNQLIYSTYLGGTQNEEGYGIAVDSYGRAYVTGFTRSTDFPTFDPIQAAKGSDGCASAPCADAFLSVLEADGRSFAYSTYLGGDQEDIANGITVDVNNNVYIVGETYSTNFPTTPGAYDVINTQTTFRDAFISKVGALGAPSAPAFSHLDSVVSTSSDDAEENASGSSVNLTSTELELTQAATNQKVGLRFTGIDLPQGAVIQNAWIQFTMSTSQTGTGASSLTLQAQASDNAPTFAASANNISSRSRTSASVTWTPPEWNTFDEGGPAQRTPNLASMIQEVVDRPGWTSGNAIAIIVTGSGKRVAKTYDRDPYGAAYLHIEYTLAPPPGELGLQITPNPTTFTSAGQNISYTYTLTNIGAVSLNGPYTVSDDKVASVDCSAAQSPLPVGQSTTCVGSYTTVAEDVTAGSVTNSATATASDGTQTITSDVASATVNYQIPPSGPVTINYVYDPLNRLTEANYLETGGYYHYTYDAVGNRLTQETFISGLPTTTNYLYDNANRMTSVNGINYDWDANGNLRSDGINDYEYDSANRLISFSNAMTTATYAYSGLGDRLQETVNGVTTTFTMDLNTGLTQALSDGTNHYIYGAGRIAQVNTTTEYFLGDALGSVRQLTDTSGAITYARAYDPYGVVTSTTGPSQSAYGFTGEIYGDSTQLLYLRARYYASYTGRFLSRDPFSGYSNLPQSQNPYTYGLNNPILYTDPSGENPLAILGAFALAIGVGATGGAIYGCFSYEWAITGQCGCELQQQALFMTKADWVGMHALVGGIASGAIALSTITPLTTVIVGGALVYYAANDFVNVLQVVYSEGVGWTTCNIVRAVLDVAIGIFGGSSVVRGIRAWRASGSVLSWESSAPGTNIHSNAPKVIRPFLNIEGETASGIRSRIPSTWSKEFGYYSPKNGPPQNIPQYKFISPDGSAELRIHGPQAPYETSWVARIGTKVPPETPGALENPFNPGEFWLYFTNEGVPTSNMSAMHIRLNTTLSDMIRVFGFGY